MAGTFYLAVSLLEAALAVEVWCKSSVNTIQPSANCRFRDLWNAKPLLIWLFIFSNKTVLIRISLTRFCLASKGVIGFSRLVGELNLSICGIVKWYLAYTFLIEMPLKNVDVFARVLMLVLVRIGNCWTHIWAPLMKYRIIPRLKVFKAYFCMLTIIMNCLIYPLWHILTLIFKLISGVLVNQLFRKKGEPWFVVFANFQSVNTAMMANFKLTRAYEMPENFNNYLTRASMNRLPHTTVSAF